MQRVRIGVVGCGDIAQIQHLPALAELADEYDVTAVCDVSQSLARYVAGWFHVPKYVTDYRQLLESDVDAVLLCHRDPKTEVAVASLDAGKHVFIEKPMCYSLEEADRIIGAAEASGKVAQVGYMKLYEPAFELARAEIATIDVDMSTMSMPWSSCFRIQHLPLPHNRLNSILATSLLTQ